ncbi:MAG: hypothetical protein DRN20_05205 [Thermoplasmata archaeon]|nr:MAG: hypothetical protein DRN20_05205 [Thermoplasmata archaeon]
MQEVIDKYRDFYGIKKNLRFVTHATGISCHQSAQNVMGYFSIVLIARSNRGFIRVVTFAHPWIIKRLFPA